MKFCRQSARFKTGFAALAFALACGLGGALASVQRPAPVATPLPEGTWRVVITGFLHPKETQTQPIPGAKDAKFAAAQAAKGGDGDGVAFLSKAEFAALGVDWAAFRARSAAAASAELAGLKVELIRDRNEVVECAILRSTAPTDNITLAVLAPDFLQRFAPLFGRKMLVAVPDQHTVYLFPKLASRYQEYGEQVLGVYGKSECPVSREVFELSAEGLRAVGEYTGP